MASDAFVQFRVTPEVKTILRAIAEREQITESALVRQLVEVMLRTQIKAGDPKLEELERASRDARLYVRLEPDDRMLLTSRATSRGMRSATYVALLVRSHLRGVTPIPKEELQAIKHSIAELSAIGRNLNQIARVAQQSGRAAGPGHQELVALLKVCEGLRDHVKALIKANLASWGVS